MGLYDTVIFECPKCGYEIEEQNKSGPCVLATFDCSEVPVAIAAAFVGSNVTCDRCENSFSVVSDKPIEAVKLSLVQALPITGGSK
jgi:hypothetical protein